MRRAILVAEFLALASSVALGQPPQEPPVFRGGTRLVQLDVVVRDKNGSVKGLSKDDFVVFDCNGSARDSRDLLSLYKTCRGKQQPIQLFHGPVGAPSPATTVRTAPGTFANRTDSRGEPVTSATVVLFDQLNTSFDHKEYLRGKAVKFLQSLGSDERVAVYSLGNNLHILQDFTDDPQKLIQSVTKLGSGLDVFPVYAGDDSLATGDGPGRPGIAAAERHVFADMYDQITLEAIKKIVQHLSGVPGRKNLVWLKETPQVALTFEHTVKTLALLREANIAVYPVMVRSLKSSGVFSMGFASRRPPPMPDLGIQKAARDLGASLGGTGFDDAADLAVAVRRAEEDSASVYTLGFYPSESDLDGKLHQLSVALSRSVTTKGRPELNYRTEYLASPQPEAPARNSLGDLLNSPLDATAIGLTAAVTRDQLKSGDYHIAVTVNLADVQFRRQGDRWAGALQAALRLEFKTTSGGITATDPVIQTLPINLTEAELQAKRASGLAVDESVSAGGKSGSLRIVIQDTSNGAVGSLRVPLGQDRK
jgi:VWFA-related protein